MLSVCYSMVDRSEADLQSAEPSCLVFCATSCTCAACVSNFMADAPPKPGRSCLSSVSRRYRFLHRPSCRV